MRRITFLPGILLSLLLASCDKYDLMGLFFMSSPAADERFSQSKEYNDGHGFSTIYVTSDDYTVYLASDAHVSNSAKGMERFVSDCLSDDTTAPFALFLGDAVDGKGTFDLFLKTVAPFSPDGRTLFCTPGNHDLFYGQWSEWVKALNTSSYIFKAVTPSAGSDLFICMDSASGTLGKSQREWLENILSAAKGKYRYIIVFTHTHFFKQDNSQGHTSNFNLEETYDLAKLFKDYGVGLVLSGHDHHYEEAFFKDVRYICVNSIEDGFEGQKYYVLDVVSSSAVSDGNPGSHLELKPVPVRF